MLTICNTTPALRFAEPGKLIIKSGGKDLHPRATLCIVIGRRKEQHRKANTMKNTTTTVATTLASAGMNAEGAAMHAAILENIAQNSPELAGLIHLAQNSNDPGVNAQGFYGILNRVSEIVLEYAELMVAATG